MPVNVLPLYYYFATQCTFLALQSLGEFTNLLRRQLRALDSRNQLARHSSYSQNTVNGGGGGGGGPPSVASLKISHTEPTVALSSKTRSGGASGGTGSSKVDRPLGALRNTSSGSSSKQAPAAPHLLLPTGDHTTNTSVGVSKTEKNAEGPAKPLYSVGDKVDGQCVLQNGSKRWYPGEVVQVITSEDGRSFAYKLRYMDGEERSDQAERDIRVPKKRKARGTSGNGNRTEDEDSGYESGKFAHRMSTDSMDSVDAEAWMDRHALKVGLGHAQHGAASDARTRADSAGSGSVEFPHNPALHPTSARSGAPRAGSFRTAEELKGTNAVLYRLQGQERPNSGAHMGGIGMPRLSINSVTSMKSVEEEGCRLRTISAEHEAEVEVETQAGAAVGAQVVEAVAVTVTDFSDDGAEAGDEAGSDGGDDEEDRVFEIPSVFEGGHRTMPPASINGSGGSKMFKEGLLFIFFFLNFHQ